MLKAAVIGTGAISKEHLSFLAKSPLVNLVGVCDLSNAAATYAARQFGAAKAYTNYQELLSETKPDIVHILTPPHTHKMIATDCLKAGAHVFCEKPITPTLTEFKDLWEVAQNCNRHLIEDHNYLFNEPILAIQDLVTQGVLGNIQDVEIRMALNVREGGRFADENLPSPVHRLPAGVIHDVLTHLVYLALPYLPSVDRVSAAWSNHGGGDLFKYDDLDALVIGGQTHVRLRFSAYTQPECFFIFVRGDRGYAETDLFQPYLRTVIPRTGGKQLSPLVNHFLNGKVLTVASIRNFYRKIMQKTPYEGLHRLLDKTYAALLKNEDPPIGFEQMERSLRLIDALLAEENRL
ncbi:MAG: Gfo/Idh/MocA family oxidoreductase [Cyanobacteria bacterium J06639_14]